MHHEFISRCLLKFLNKDRIGRKIELKYAISKFFLPHDRLKFQNIQRVVIDAMMHRVEDVVQDLDYFIPFIVKTARENSRSK